LEGRVLYTEGKESKNSKLYKSNEYIRVKDERMMSCLIVAVENSSIVSFDRKLVKAITNLDLINFVKRE
jgi:hypothetical protein